MLSKNSNILRLSVQIWAVANLAVLAVFCLALVPGAGTAAMWSSLFSLPAVPLLYAVLCGLRRLHGHWAFSWVVLLAATGAATLLAFALFCWAFSPFTGEMAFVRPLCFVCGYAAVLLFCFPLQNLFLKFQHEND